MLSAYVRFKSLPIKKIIFAYLPTKQIFLRRILSNSSSTHHYSVLSALSSSSELHSATPASPSCSENPTSKKKEVNQRFTVSYLTDSCGLSPEAAISASKKVHFTALERPDSVLNLLKSHGFTPRQVTFLVRQYPELLVADAEKTLLPKLQFYQSIGFSRTNLAKTIAYSSGFLLMSLKNHIMPNYNFLKSIVQSDQKVCSILKRFPQHAFCVPCEKCLVPNISLLRKLGVPETSIAFLLTHFPITVARKPENFSETISTVKNMGFSPLKVVFVLAVHAFSGKSNRSLWDRCYKTCMKWGWSDDDILSAFKKQPNCMLLSEKKITRTMEVLVNKMGWTSKTIVANPGVLFFSLEKRIIPRCLVIDVLRSKGLLKKDLSVGTMLVPSEKCFIKRFIAKHEG